jgi:hypothetical protein
VIEGRAAAQPVGSLAARVADGDRQYADVLADIEPYTVRKPAAETGSVLRAA